MQPIKVIIPGHYWDSFIYNGNLYLWKIDGSIRTIEWDALISNWNCDRDTNTILQLAFSHSDHLYSRTMDLLLADVDISDLIKKKINHLCTTANTIEDSTLSKHEVGHQDNPFPFPHADLEVYSNKAYVASTSGITSASIGTATKYPISTKPIRKWDAPVHRIKAAHGVLALAAGNEGLYEVPIGDSFSNRSASRNDVPLRLSGDTCSDCNWTYWSIFGSNNQGGFLASFDINQPSTRSDSNYIYNDLAEIRGRRFNRIITSDEIWEHQNYAIGVQDKLCQISEGQIDVIRYSPWEAERAIERIGHLGIDNVGKDTLSAAIAPFGIVTELDDSLCVNTSDGTRIRLEGEPSNWRTFSRAKHYANQLHVVKEDYLEIYSFFHDYFTDQEEKVSGLYVGNNYR